MPKYRLTRRTIDITTIVVEAPNEDAASDMDDDGSFDHLWENADWDEWDDEPIGIDKAEAGEPLTKPYEEPKKADVEAVLASAYMPPGA